MKIKYSILAICSLLISFSTSVLAGPLDPKNVPEKADWFVHVNFDELSQGKISEWIDQLNFMLLFETGEESPMAYFTDAENNLSGGVTAYGIGEDPKNSVVRATGLNNKEALLSEIRSAKKYQTSTSGTYTIHSWADEMKDKEIRGYGTFIDDTTMIASHSSEALEQALKFLGNDDKAIKAPANLGSALLVRANLEAISRHAGSRVFQKAKSMEAAMDVAQDGSLSGAVQLETSDRDSADRMYKMIDAMITFGSAYVQEGQWNPSKNVKSKQNGNKIEMEMTMPISYIEKFINNKQQKYRRGSGEEA